MRKLQVFPVLFSYIKSEKQKFKQKWHMQSGDHFVEQPLVLFLKAIHTYDLFISDWLFEVLGNRLSCF